MSLSIFRAISGLGAAAAVAVILATPAEARRIDEAEAKVQSTIDDLAIDRSRIKSVYLAPNVLGARSHGAQSYTGWISFTDCTGNLAITMTSTAHISTMYTTGNCAVPGVTN